MRIVAISTLITASALIAPSAAFTPSSFTPSNQNLQTSASSSPRCNSALSMNLFDRFSRVAKSNLNNVLKTLEDPEKIMNQAVEDMQTDLVKIRQSYAEVTASQRRFVKQKEAADAMGDDWYKRAQLALENGNDDLAREALTRRQQQIDAATALQDQIDVQNASIDKLYEGMQVLESKIMESRAKKEQMVARARTAASTQKVNDMLGGVTGKTSMDAFNRMEEKVEALEAAAEVSAEMGSMGGMALPGYSEGSIEKQFKLMESGSAVDDELSQMKKLLGGSADAEDTGSSSSSAGDSKSMDDELEKLKRDAGL